MNLIMSKFKFHKRQLVATAITAAILITFVYYVDSGEKKPEFTEHKSLKTPGKQVDPNLYRRSQKWLVESCLGASDKLSMESLDVYIEMLRVSAVPDCQVVHEIFTAMFELEVVYGEIRIDNDSFRKKVLKWLDNNNEYLNQAYKQKVIKLFNKFYHDEMIFNALRGKRPQTKQALSEKNYTMDLLRESETGCDFCNNNYKTNTANDIFERLESNLSYSAANTFKYDKWHSLIVSRNHNTLKLSEADMIDMFNLCTKWFEKVNSLNRQAVYPELIWDAMPKSGASQVHTHLQVSMGERGYYGLMRRWLDASARYFIRHSRDFLEDFVLIHRTLGLTYEFRNVLVIINLIPLKDQEVMILGKNDPKTYEEVSRTLHKVIRVFVDTLEQYSFSTGMYLPEFGTVHNDEPMFRSKLTKIFARITFRSPVANLRSDFNGLDLYTSSVIGLDRYKLARSLFAELKAME